MKETTIHSLVIARTLFERAIGLCNSDDSHLASAGLVIIQDALEMVFYALLIELGVDEAKNLESKSFDELLSELKKAGISVQKSGTLKALNKQRVLTKHYAQIAEPVTVRNYFTTAEQAMDIVVKAVTGRSIRELYLADFLVDGEAKSYLKSAETLIGEKKYFDALVEIRKAIFVEFEVAYSIYAWRDYDGGSKGIGLALIAQGLNAPYWTRNREWISAHVHEPTDYVQIDFDNWRIKAMELGIHTAELENLRRLTPPVFRADPTAKWCVKREFEFEANDATEANAKYCLDRAIAIILKKQEHSKVARRRSRGAKFDLPPVYLGQYVYKTASIDSEVVHVVSEGYNYVVDNVVDGFNPDHKFYEIWGSSEALNDKGFAKEVFRGFLKIQS
jgi:hypothetical protein